MSVPISQHPRQRKTLLVKPKPFTLKKSSPELNLSTTYHNISQISIISLYQRLNSQARYSINEGQPHASAENQRQWQPPSPSGPTASPPVHCSTGRPSDDPAQPIPENPLPGEAAPSVSVSRLHAAHLLEHCCRRSKQARAPTTRRRLRCLLRTRLSFLESPKEPPSMKYSAPRIPLSLLAMMTRRLLRWFSSYFEFRLS